MKKVNLLSMYDSGVFDITANSIDATNAYKVLKFKREGRKAYESYADSEKSIQEEVGIMDAEAFDKERHDLLANNSNPARLEEMNKQFERYCELRRALLDEEVTFSCNAIPYALFHELQRENQHIQNKPLNIFEELLEGILWEAPE